jgi:hypothetical protein
VQHVISATGGGTELSMTVSCACLACMGAHPGASGESTVNELQTFWDVDAAPTEASAIAFLAPAPRRLRACSDSVVLNSVIISRLQRGWTCGASTQGVVHEQAVQIHCKRVSRGVPMTLRCYDGTMSCHASRNDTSRAQEYATRQTAHLFGTQQIAPPRAKDRQRFETQLAVGTHRQD